MKLAQVLLAAVGLTLGAACSSGGGEGPQLVAAPTLPTATVAVPTETAAPSPLPAVAPTLAPESSATLAFTPLPPAPPRPGTPAVANAATVVGGQWYELIECFVAYVPAGWT